MIVNVDEAELSRRYSGFVTPQSLLTCLTDGKGTVLSSTDKEMLGTVFPVFNTVSKAWRQKGSGYVTTGLAGQRVVAFYVKSSVNDLSLIPLCDMEIMKIVVDLLESDKAAYEDTHMVLPAFKRFSETEPYDQSCNCLLYTSRCV